MVKTTLIVCCGLLLGVAAARAVLPGSAKSAPVHYSVGDMVTTIRDCSLSAQNRVVEKVSAGATLVVKKVDGASLLFASEAVGWLSANDVIPLERAIPYFSDLIERDPQDVCNYYWRAGVFQTKGEYDRAIQDYGEAIRLRPALAPFYVGRGVCFLGKKDFPRAMSDFAEALKLDPKSAGAYLGRSGAFCETGDYASGFSDLRTAILLEPKSINARASLAELLACCPDAKIRNSEMAMQVAAEVCQEAEWKDSQLLHYLACAYAERGDFDSATKWEKEAIRLNPAERTGYLANFQKACALFEAKQPVREIMAFIQ